MENKLPPVASSGSHAPRVAGSGRTHSATRETLLRLLEAQHEPTTIASLAAASGCHENTVRGHVHALWRDGFLDRELAPAAGKGRPSWLWRAVTPQPDSPYAGLARALAEGLAELGPEAADRARAVGRTWGRTLATQLPPATTRSDVERTVLTVMQEQGFAPTPARAGGLGREAEDNTTTDTSATSATSVRLRRCPLVAVAAHRPEIVCAVHLGMVTGAVEALGASDIGTTLTPMSGPGECTLDLRVRA